MKNFRKKLVVGCLGLVGICFIVIVVLIVAVGIGIEGGWIPDTEANPIGKIPARQIKELKKMGVVKPDETVLFFYSTAMFSIRGDGNLFTDQRVISYQESDGELELNEATYDRITSIDFQQSDNWLDDSTIIITTEDGTWFVLYVSTESNGDKLFYEKLNELWKQNQHTDPLGG